MKIVLFVALLLILFTLMGSAIASDGIDFIKEGVPTVVLVVGSYIGAFLGSLIIKDEKGARVSMVLYGSVGWVAAFLAHYFELFNLNELGTAMGFVIFALFGMVLYVAFTLLDTSRERDN